MKHRIKDSPLSRTREHRKSLMKNLSVALFCYGHIKTTQAKLNHFKSYIGKFISRFLSKDRFNAYKYFAKNINDNKSIIAHGMLFYDKKITEEKLSNYICTKKVSLKHSSGGNIVIIYFIRDSI